MMRPTRKSVLFSLQKMCQLDKRSIKLHLINCMALCVAINHNLNNMRLLPRSNSLSDLFEIFEDDNKLRKVVVFQNQLVKLFC